MPKVEPKQITIENIFPGYNAAPNPLKKQYEYLFKLFSVPLCCPVCKESHSYAFIKLNDHKCPNSEKRLERKVTFFGEQFFVWNENYKGEEHEKI